MKPCQLFRLFVLLFFGVPACNAQPGTVSGDAEVVVAMEGSVHELETVTWLNSTVATVGEDIQFHLVEDGKPIQVNLNMKISAIPENGTATFNMPEVNHDGFTIELSFMNLERDSSRMQKRIIFDTGVIEVLEYGPNHLRMTFDGSGKPLRSKERFPIEGLINIDF